MTTVTLNEAPAFPSAVEIQTTSACNARCEVCPHSDVIEEIGAGLMPSTLLWKILDECAANREHLRWVMPYYNAEPFIDKRMPEILRFIKKNTSARVELSSNGALLRPDLSECILADSLVDVMRFSVFGAEASDYEANMAGLSWGVSRPRIEEFLRLRKAACSAVQVEIILVGGRSLPATAVAAARRQWEPLGAQVKVFGFLDRAGNNRRQRDILPRHQATARLIGCDLNRPFERICILRNGQATLCSQDWRGETDLGNVESALIHELWMGEAYRAMRAKVAGETLAESSFICRRCKLAIVE